MAAFVDDGIKAAIAAVRADSSPEDWVLIGYEGKDKLVLIGTGTGGVTALKDKLIPNDVCYGMVRKSHEFESAGAVSAQTVKFIWIYWRPEEIPVMRKMKIGVFEGQVKQLFQPYHVDIQASVLDEVSEDVVLNVLDNITMKADKTGNAASTGAALGARSTIQGVNRQEAKGFLPTGSSADTANKKVGGAAIAFDDEAAFKSALMAVRSDTDETDWALLGYKDSSTLQVIGTGNGGLSELLAACTDGSVCYGVFKVTDTFDMTVNVRFCFITWQPEDVAPMAKARITTQRGGVTSAIRNVLPYQYEFRVTTREELTMEGVKSHIGQLSGTASKIGDASDVTADTPSHRRRSAANAKSQERTFLGGVPGTAQRLTLADEAAIKSALAQVRNDKDETNFVLVYFNDSNQLELGDVGNGGLPALKIALLTRPATYSYAILRVTEAIDNSETIKFCHIKWHPETVAPQLRGRLGVMVGGVSELFSPHHGAITATSEDEFTMDIVMDCVSKERAHNK